MGNKYGWSLCFILQQVSNFIISINSSYIIHRSLGNDEFMVMYGYGANFDIYVANKLVHLYIFYW